MIWQIHWSKVGNAVVTIFAVLGGGMGIMRILEWSFNKPKIKGFIYQPITWVSIEKNLTALLLKTHLVNKRISPTTISKWELKIKKGHIERMVEHSVIPDDFELWDNERLGWRTHIPKIHQYHKAEEEALGYGIGMKIWLLFMVRELTKEDCKEATLILILTDAFGRKHKIKQKLNKIKEETIVDPSSLLF